MRLNVRVLGTEELLGALDGLRNLRIRREKLLIPIQHPL
jgi:hypothetical protein